LKDKKTIKAVPICESPISKGAINTLYVDSKHISSGIINITMGADRGIKFFISSLD
jgi:hypothetical protein